MALNQANFNFGVDYKKEQQIYQPFEKDFETYNRHFTVSRDDLSINAPKYATTDDLDKMREDRTSDKRMQGFINASNGFAEVSQALINYKQFSENAERNIRLIQDDIDRLGDNAETIRRSGRAAGFQEHQKGQQRADDSKLRLAAQGQKVSGRGVKRVSRSHRLAAATRAMQVENASIERALGLEQEQVSLKLEQADTQRKKAYARLQANVKAFGGLTNAGLGVYSGLQG